MILININFKYKILRDQNKIASLLNTFCPVCRSGSLLSCSSWSFSQLLYQLRLFRGIFTYQICQKTEGPLLHGL